MKYFKELKTEYKIAFVISGFFFLLTAMTSYYYDLQSLTVWSINIWDTLYMTGNPLNYYSYSAQNLHGLVHPMVGSDIIIYLPWAVWNIPLWILHRFFRVSIVGNCFALFYSKSFLIALSVGCTVLLRKMGVLLTQEKETENIYAGCFLFLSSFFTLTSVAYTGQNDILVIFVFLLGLHALLKGNFNGFLFWAALSIGFKPFFIFPYIAIIMFKEKRIHYILLYLLSSMSVYVVQKLPFWNAPMYQESLAQGPTAYTFQLLLESSLPLTPVHASVFAMGLLIVYLLAYFDHPEENGSYKVIYYCMLSFLCYFLFTRYEYYRPLYLVPFIYLIIMARPAFRRINLLLEMATTAFLIYYFVYNTFFFFDNNFIHFPLSKEAPMTITQLAVRLFPTVYNTVAMAFVIVCMGLFAIINHPRFQSRNNILTMKEERYLIILRSLLFAAPYVVAVLLMYV